MFIGAQYMVVHVYNVRLCMYSLCVHARSYLSVCVCICVCVLTCMHVIVYMHVHMHMAVSYTHLTLPTNREV